MENDPLYQTYLEDTMYMGFPPFKPKPSFESWKKDHLKNQLRSQFLHLVDTYFGVKNAPVISGFDSKFVNNKRWREAFIKIMNGEKDVSYFTQVIHDLESVRDIVMKYSEKIL